MGALRVAKSPTFLKAENQDGADAQTDLNLSYTHANFYHMLHISSAVTYSLAR